MKKIFLILLLSSCSNPNQTNLSKYIIDFDKLSSLNEYKKILKVYNEKSKYPNLNN
jgi:hypothetical protein